MQKRINAFGTTDQNQVVVEAQKQHLSQIRHLMKDELGEAHNGYRSLGSITDDLYLFTEDEKLFPYMLEHCPLTKSLFVTFKLKRESFIEEATKLPKLMKNDLAEKKGNPSLVVQNFPSVTGSVCERLKQDWRQILEHVPDDLRKSPVIAILKSGVQPVSFDDNVLVLSFRYPYLKEKLEQIESKIAAEKIFRNYLGCDCKVQSVLENKGVDPIKVEEMLHQDEKEKELYSVVHDSISWRQFAEEKFYLNYESELQAILKQHRSLRIELGNILSEIETSLLSSEYLKNNCTWCPLKIEKASVRWTPLVGQELL